MIKKENENKFFLDAIVCLIGCLMILGNLNMVVSKGTDVIPPPVPESPGVKTFIELPGTSAESLTPEFKWKEVAQKMYPICLK